MSDFSINVKIGGVETAVKTIGEIEAALRATKQELKGVEVGSVAFENLSKQAQKLQFQFKENFKEATNFYQSLGDLGESVGRLASTITSGFAIATSAVGLFGGDAKNLSEEQVKAQQALTLALSATTIATNAKRFAEDAGNLATGLQTGLVKVLTVLTGAQTAATQAGTVATGQATIAQRILNATMAANPIGILIVAITSLVGAYLLFSDSTEKAKVSQSDLNEEIDKGTDAVNRELAVQKELIKIRGQVAEATAKSESERLSIRIKTQSATDSIDAKALENNKAGIKEKIALFQTELNFDAVRVQSLIDNGKKLGDFDAASRLSEQDRQINALNQRKKFNTDGTFTDEMYYTQLIAIQKKYNYDTEEASKKEFDDKKNKQLDLFKQLSIVNSQIQVQQEQTNANAIKGDAETTRLNVEQYNKRRQALETFNLDNQRLNNLRIEAQLAAERKLADFQLERISLVKGQDGVFREDLIKGYDETIAKLNILKQRETEDSKREFDLQTKLVQDKYDKSLKAAVKEGTATKEVRKVLTANLTTELDTLKINYDSRLSVAKKYGDDAVGVEEDKANRIKEINTVLNTELTYGGSDLSDSLKRIALDQLNFEIGLSDRRIALNRSLNGTLLSFDEEAIIQRQKLQKSALEAERVAAIQELTIKTQQEINQVEGTEEQKAEQRKRLQAKLNSDIDNINRDFNLKEQEADKMSQDEIWAYRVKKLQEYAQLGQTIASTITSYVTALNEQERQAGEQRINESRDQAVREKNIAVEKYDAEKAALENQLASGMISRAQYDAAILSMKSAYDNSVKVADKKAKDTLDKERLAAFEKDKKMKKAQAVIAGALGAVQAFGAGFASGLPFPANLILAGALSAAVIATTAVQVKTIESSTFDTGAPTLESPSTSGGGSGGSTSTGGDVVTTASGGGFTGFRQDLTNSTSGGTGGTGGRSSEYQRVYVLESDITNAQRRVSVAEYNATI